jgi:uncharacterized protein CbrC (UPF0167 family)
VTSNDRHRPVALNTAMCSEERDGTRYASAAQHGIVSVVCDGCQIPAQAARNVHSMTCVLMTRIADTGCVVHGDKYPGSVLRRFACRTSDIESWVEVARPHRCNVDRRCEMRAMAGWRRIVLHTNAAAVLRTRLPTELVKVIIALMQQSIFEDACPSTRLKKR